MRRWSAVTRRSLDAVRTDTLLHLDLMALDALVRFMSYLDIKHLLVFEFLL